MLSFSLTKYRGLLFRTLLFSAWYFLLFFQLNFGISEEIMFFTPDSKEYLATATEFFDLSSTGFSETRPFLFAIILYTLHFLLGVFGIWLFHFTLWLSTLQLLYASLNKISKSMYIAIAGTSLLAINLTYHVLTLHGLTEITAIFLITVLLFISVNNYSTSQQKFIRMLFVLLLLALIKPLFYPLFLLLLAIYLCYLIYTKLIAHRKILVQLILVLLPLLIQLSVMTYKYNQFTVSKIGTLTLKNYIFTQGIAEKNKLSWEEALAHAQNFNDQEMYAEMKNNFGLYIGLYYQNLKYNLDSGPVFLVLPDQYKHEKLAEIQWKINHLYYYLHLLFFPLLLILLAFLMIKKLYQEFCVWFFLSTLLIYIFLTSAITLWQGDRIVIIAIPIFITLYCFVCSEIIRQIREKLNQQY